MVNTSTVFPTSHVVVVALHESININSNIFTHIALRISTKRESRFSRRLARQSRRVLGKVCSNAAAFVSKIRRVLKPKTKDKPFTKNELVVCVALHDTINTSENVFNDIARAIHQRSNNALKQHKDNEEKGTQDDKNAKHVHQHSKKRGFRVLNAVKGCFMCGGSAVEMSLQKADAA